MKCTLQNTTKQQQQQQQQQKTTTQTYHHVALQSIFASKGAVAVAADFVLDLQVY
jgi:hypothetical protein